MTQTDRLLLRDLADIGGWNTIDEVKKSYGEMPADIRLKILGDVMK